MTTKKMTKEEDDVLYNHIFDYKTTYSQGLLSHELEAIKMKYPSIIEKRFNTAMEGDTCIITDDGSILYYHICVYNAIKSGIEDKDLHYIEWE